MAKINRAIQPAKESEDSTSAVKKKSPHLTEAMLGKAEQFIMTMAKVLNLYSNDLNLFWLIVKRFLFKIASKFLFFIMPFFLMGSFM